MKGNAVGAVGAQGAQAIGSFVIQIIVVRTLGLGGLGTFSILFGVMVLVAGILTGFVGDSLVVLDRRSHPVRAALEQYALALSVAAGLVSAVVATIAGLITVPQAVLFGISVLFFGLEEIMRRLLMANFLFWRVAIIDSFSFLVVLAYVGIAALVHGIDLEVFLAAIALGQFAAILLGARLLPREERFAVRFGRGDFRGVAAYGIWRSSQQLLRPGLLTVIRTMVTIFIGLAATGLLETARVYVAPAMLVITGLASFLFVSYARDKNAKVSVQLPKADRAVLAMLGITVAMGVVLLAFLPLLGPLLFGTTPQLAAVVGWLLYTASVSAVTPYGALAAVGGRQSLVFAFRLSDTIVSGISVLILLALGGPPELAPIVMCVGSIAGGIGIRVFILSPAMRRERAQSVELGESAATL
jgi:O-antigen/teichoic acid export membrane protein